jgi:hypothetical protein
MNIMMDAIFSLNEGKSKDADEISSEHFLYAPVSLVSRLVDLTNHMLRHSYVPNQFKLGVILPLVDTGGDKTDLQNYRGITISPILSKIFEHVIRILFQPFLLSSDYH